MIKRQEIDIPENERSDIFKFKEKRTLFSYLFDTDFFRNPERPIQTLVYNREKNKSLFFFLFSAVGSLSFLFLFASPHAHFLLAAVVADSLILGMKRERIDDIALLLAFIESTPARPAI